MAIRMTTITRMITTTIIHMSIPTIMARMIMGTMCMRHRLPLFINPASTASG